MINIKKYNIFESDDWMESFYHHIDYPSYKKISYTIYDTPWRSEHKKLDLVYARSYVKKMQEGDEIYHDVYGKGFVTDIKSDDYYTYLVIYFDDKQYREFRMDCEYLKIEKKLANIINGRTLEEEESSVEEKEETIEDLRKKMIHAENTIKKIIKDNQLIRKNFDETKKYLIKLKEENKKYIEENQKLQKQLDEYEGLKDAMKKFKGQIDPFGEETWIKKKK